MKKIAVVSNLPSWEASVPYCRPASAGHYCVWLSEVCKALEKQKVYEIHWLILDKDVKEKKIIETRGQYFHILPKARLTIGLCTGYIYDTWVILQTLKKIEPDLVHSWGTENSYSFAVSHTKYTKLLSVQGLLKACSERARIAVFERMHALYEPYTIQKFQHITTESPWASDRVREMASSANPFFLEYAVEEEFFSQKRRLAETPTCLYGGTNTPVKNIASLIKVFSSPELANIKLIMAGVKADSFPSAPDNIRFLGRINRQRMINEMSQAWCLIHPSLADTGPTIVKEARVMGLPVLLTTECGSKQHIVHGKSGYIVEPRNINAMRDCVLRLTENRETAESMGRYGQEECRQKLSNDTMIRNLLRIYGEIIG